MDPRYMDMARNPMHFGVQQMQNMGQSEQYKTKTLYEIIKYLHLAAPQVNKKDLLMHLLQRNMDNENNFDAFSKAYQKNEMDMKTRQNLGVPQNMPFTPGTTWM